MSDDSALGGFPGTARLFPLPNLVLFPNVVQPLHVFEPRYREMTADAVRGDRQITVALLQPGWEDLYNGRPALYPVACLGRIIADQLLPDGRYNLLLRGVSRVRLGREVESPKPYRIAEAELLEDCPPVELETAKRLRKQLADKVLPRFDAEGSAKNQLNDLFHGELTLGSLCDVLSFALPFPPELKQGLLAELNVEARVARFLEMLESQAPGVERKFPPDFSQN